MILYYTSKAKGILGFFIEKIVAFSRLFTGEIGFVTLPPFMVLFGTFCLVFGIAILFNPALLGFIVGFLLIILGSWVILGWYKINKVLEKKFSVGKYNIIFQENTSSSKKKGS